MNNVQRIVDEIIEFIKKYYQDNKMGGAIIGLSGGKDSAVCLALMVKAIGSENVLGLWLPDHSKEEDKMDAKLLAEMYNIELKEFDISKYSELFIDDIKEKNEVNNNDLEDVIINCKPRLRMLTLYSYAALMTKLTKKGYLVVGTSNKSERFVGYFTKGGDGVCDIAPIADLYVDEVIQIGDYLALPKHITHKTPEDGLSSFSDEEKLGFTYDDVKKVAEEIRTDKINNEINNATREKILNQHQKNLHKFHTPMYEVKR